MREVNRIKENIERKQYGCTEVKEVNRIKEDIEKKQYGCTEVREVVLYVQEVCPFLHSELIYKMDKTS